MIQEYMSKKVNMLLELNKPKELTTCWTINNIMERLDSSPLVKEFPTTHSELLANLYQGAGVKLDGVSTSSSDLFKKSYDIWKVVWNESVKAGKIELKQLFYLASNGLLADELAEVRMILMENNLENNYQSSDNQNWPEILENTIYLIILVLIRKSNGWEDMELVDSLILKLQAEQKRKEEVYYSELNEEALTEALYWSVALFSVLEAIEKYKGFVLSGKPDNVEKVIQRYCRDAFELLNAIGNEEAKFIFILIEKVLIKLTTLSIWSCISGVSEKLDKYISVLTDDSL